MKRFILTLIQQYWCAFRCAGHFVPTAALLTFRFLFLQQTDKAIIEITTYNGYPSSRPATSRRRPNLTISVRFASPVHQLESSHRQIALDAQQRAISLARANSYDFDFD